jgi:flagellar FliJ protein
MKKFAFSLQTVLDFKNQYLNEAKNEYSAAMADVNHQQEIIMNLNRLYDKTNVEYNEKKLIGIGIYEMTKYDTYLKKINSDIEKEMIRLKELEEILEVKFNAMVKAKQEVTSLDKLREKRYDAYNYAVQKSEELLIEEFVSNKSVAR